MDTAFRTGNYISPSGQSFTPFWSDPLEISVSHNIAAFAFAKTNDGVVVDLGTAPELTSFSCFFDGQGYQKVAESFYRALKEIGVAMFEHPLWGNKNVIPTSIKKRENVVSSIGRVSFELEFIVVPPNALNQDHLGSEYSPLLLQESLLISGQSTLNRLLKSLDFLFSVLEFATLQNAINNIIGLINNSMGALYRITNQIKQHITLLHIACDSVMGSPASAVKALNSLFFVVSKGDDQSNQLIPLSEKLSFLQQLLPSEQSVDAVTDRAGSLALLTISTSVTIALINALGCHSYEHRIDAKNALCLAQYYFNNFITLCEQLEPFYVVDASVLHALHSHCACTSNYLLARLWGAKFIHYYNNTREQTLFDVAITLYDDAERMEELAALNEFSLTSLLVVPIGYEVAYYE